MEDREESDYGEIPNVDRELAQKRLDDARRFVNEISSYLVSQGLKVE